MARAKRKTPKKPAAPLAAAPTMRYTDEQAIAWLNGEEAIARLIRLAKHPNKAVSDAASVELLEMLSRRSLQLLQRPTEKRSAR